MSRAAADRTLVAEVRRGPGTDEGRAMLERLRKRVTYANVTSTLALFLALTTGTAYAANEWTGANIRDGSITSADIKNGTVSGTDIKNATVTSSDIADAAVGGSEIADGTVATADILAALQASYKKLRGEVAVAIHRRKTPELTFHVLRAS